MNAYLATGILVPALLRVGGSIFVRLVVSLFIIALVWPIQAALQRFLPKLLALFVSPSITIAVVVGDCAQAPSSRLIAALLASSKMKVSEVQAEAKVRCGRTRGRPKNRSVNPWH